LRSLDRDKIYIQFSCTVILYIWTPVFVKAVAGAARRDAVASTRLRGQAFDLRNARETLLCASWTAACMTAFALWTQASGNVLNRAKQEERPNADY
jgi:hypothetical protein